MTLTKKQESVIRFIEQYQLEYGKSPTVRELKTHFQLQSDNSIIKIVKALREKGYLEKDSTPRGIKLLNKVKEKLEEVKNLIRLPILGEINAGAPILSEENYMGRMTVGNVGVKNPQSSFLLRVRGDSMKDAGIFEGDLVIVDNNKQAKNGDVVVAFVDHEHTVKRYVKEKDGTIYLKPENSAYSLIHPKEKLQIQGVVTGLLREY